MIKSEWDFLAILKFLGIIAFFTFLGGLLGRKTAKPVKSNNADLKFINNSIYTVIENMEESEFLEIISERRGYEVSIIKTDTLKNLLDSEDEPTN